MRAINTGDVFRLARIIKAADIKDQIVGFVKKGQEISPKILESDTDKIKEKKKREYDEKIKDLGVDIVFSILMNCVDEKIEKQLYILMGDILEKKPDEVREQPLEQTVSDIKEIIDNNDTISFFRKALNVDIS